MGLSAKEAGPMPAVINVIGFIRKDQTMHNHAISRKKTSPLEKIMMDINNLSFEITIIAGWLGYPEYGNMESSRKSLELCSDRLDIIYEQLRELTGAHPCK